jgi:hypothetical protein
VVFAVPENQSCGRNLITSALMLQSVVALAALVPAVPGLVSLVQAVHARSNRLARAIIVSGALTLVAGGAALAVNAIPAFSGVAAARPEEKARTLAAGLDQGGVPLTTALWVGAALCLAGGVVRSLFSRGVEGGRHAPSPTETAGR